MYSTVAECVELGPVLVARDDDVVVGWVGLRPSYARVWELHPLVVDPLRRREGIGRMLVTPDANGFGKPDIHRRNASPSREC
jgi:predicted N-acetyltransferase YhbS